MLTIGMPVYNGGVYLRSALESILTQDFRQFSLFVSDNASSDETESVLREFANRDSRLTFVRQEKNIGPVANFELVAKDISTPYFMWFACDDIMEPGFLRYCIQTLEANPSCGMAFSGLVNIDSLGRTIREYHSLSYFSGAPSFWTVSRYILSPEIFGKANLIYSVYRIEVIKRAIERFGLPLEWGGDMGFVLSALIEGGISISPDVLFRKRWVRVGDDGEVPMPVTIPERLLDQCCPLLHFEEYESLMCRAATGSNLAWLVVFLMRFRRLRLENLDRISKQPTDSKSHFSKLHQLINFFKDVFKSGAHTFQFIRGVG